MDPESRMAREQLTGFIIDALHGSTRDIKKFDKGLFGSKLGHYGAQNYFTDSPHDASVHYAGYGPDLNFRIEDLQEQFREDEDAIIEWWWRQDDTLKEQYGGFDEDDITQEQRELALYSLAEEALGIENEGVTYPVKLRIPKIVRVETIEEPTFWEYEVEYDEEGDEVVFEGGPAQDLMLTLDSVMTYWNVYGPEADTAMTSLWEHIYDNGGISAEDFEFTIRNTVYDLYDDVTGEPVSSGQLIADVYEAMGYDGVVHNAYKAFGGGMELEPDTYHYIVFDGANVRSIFAKFDPEKVGVNDLTASRRVPHAGLVSTRFMNATSATEDPIADLIVNDFASFRGATSVGKGKKAINLFGRNMESVKQYPNMTLRQARMNHADAAEAFVKHVTDNILFLYDMAERDLGKPLVMRMSKWYEGANTVSKDYAGRYKITPYQSAGVIATLSPQKDWYVNASLAERVLDIYFDNLNSNTVFGEDMRNKAREIFLPEEGISPKSFARNTELFERLDGKRFNELTDDVERAFWLRTYDETYNPSHYRVVSPEGKFLDYAKTKNGEEDSIAWGGLLTIAKALSGIRDGSYENINANLGTFNKVRNFYNNIVDPNAKQGFVTIDTHAVAAGLLRPLAGEDIEVKHNFGAGKGASNSAVSGHNGTYSLYEEAYRRAAKKRGILPRQMQSIAWESVRSLFPADWKGVSTNTDPINNLWNQYRNMKLNAQEVRDAIVESRGKLTKPDWAGPHRKVHGKAQDTTYAKRVSGAGVREGDVGTGRDSDNARPIPTDVPFSRRVTELDPAEVQKVVDANKLAAENAGLAVPYFSYRASPEAQFIAANPDQGTKVSRKEILASMRRPTLDPDVQEILDRTAPASPSQVTPYEAMRNAVGALDTPSQFEYWLTKFKQEAINRYARMEKLNWTTHLRENLADSSSIAALLHADRAMGLMSAAIRYGVPVYENGWVQIKGEEDGGYKSLLEVMSHLYHNGHDYTQLAKGYAISIRGHRLELRDDKEIEVPIQEAERQQIMQQVDALTDESGYNPIKQWHEEWQTYNNYVIQLMRDAGILTEETAQLWRDYADYYPFYRVAEGGGKLFHQGQQVFGGMTGAVNLRELKGGEAPINMELIEAINNNVSAAIQMSLKNIAQQRVVRDLRQLALAEEIPIGRESRAPVVELRIDGVSRRFAIYDPLVYESLLPLDGTDTVSMIKHTFGFPATALRELVTRTPGFMMVNLLRDSLSSYVTSGARLTPIVSTLKGLADGVSRLEKLGVVGGYDLQNDPDDIVKFYKKMLRKEGLVKDGKMTGIEMFKSLWDGLGQWTTASDAATRNAVFDDTFARTGNIAEAAFQAQEVINFGRRGRHPFARMLGAVVPFLNARFQGVDVFYRAHIGQYTADKQKNRMQVVTSTMLRGSLLLSMTALYYALVSDDEQYEKVDDYVRENNWVIPTPWGVPITIPIPFEVGLLYKVIPEMILRQVTQQDSGADAYDTLKRGIGATLEISPFQIQFAGPVLEAWINYNAFTGRQIVPQYMLDSTPSGLQYEPWTSEIAKFVGKNAPFGISPMKFDHVVTGYIGTMGGYLYSLIDAVLKSETIQGDNKSVLPTREWFDYPVIKRLFGNRRASGLVQDMYQLQRATEQVYKTVNTMKKEGRGDELYAFIKGREHLLAMYKGMSTIKQRVDKLKNYRDQVLRSNMDPDLKQQQVNLIEAYIATLLSATIPEMKKQADLPFFNPLYRE